MEELNRCEMNPSNEGNETASIRAVARQGVAPRFHWYHFYFVLAIFDLVVIMASLALYHSALDSYQVALDNVQGIGQKHLWVADLRRMVINLNAPGNDVFETRQVVKEEKRFDFARSELDRILGRETEFDVDLSNFRVHLENMIGEERTIFELFHKLMEPGQLNDAERGRLKQLASTSMASMDRAQADALMQLSEIEDALLAEKEQLLIAYGTDLERSANFEKYFMALVILILGGIFWYGRKLHGTHEKLVEHEQRIIAERQHRLADIGKVCSAVSHGIRNPLASIMSSAELVLQNSALDDATRGQLNSILNQGQRLDKRIDRLLDFSRAFNEEFKRLDVKEVIEQAVVEIKPTFDERNIHIEIDFDNESTNILGERDLLAQSFIEVLSNALDHVESGGRVDIVCRRGEERPGFVLIHFIDDGPGIREQIRPRVFDLFFTSKAGGTGLGLASVKRSIELHGGEVAALANNGSGANIRILLPIV